MSNDSVAPKLNPIAAACAAQAAYCAKKGLPHFTPHNGVCFSCYGQIYTEVSGESLVTGCPLCHRSYCD